MAELCFYFNIIFFLTNVLCVCVCVCVGCVESSLYCFSSCGMWAYLPCTTWDPSSPTRIEPAVPAMEGGVSCLLVLTQIN